MGLLRNMIIKYKMRKSPVKYLRSIGVTIGDNVEIYPTANFGTEPYLISIGDNVRIMTNSIVFGDITIGNNVVIGAGSVVFKNIPSDCVVVGNPARIVKKEGVKTNILLWFI